MLNMLKESKLQNGRSCGPGEPGFHDHIVDRAAKLLIDVGYEGFTMRRLAKEVGCSAMALYRHFPNKESLILHLCSQLYKAYAAAVKQEFNSTLPPWTRLKRLIAAVIRFGVEYPDHYTLIFLVRHPDPAVGAEREKLGREFLAEIIIVVKQLLPKEMRKRMAWMRLQQMLACLHGTVALLIAHPGAYELTPEIATRNAEIAIGRILFDVEAPNQ
jgi:AcrR family transcriptional regulator